MKIKGTSYPLIRLPQKVELILFLIREELKSNKFFNGLAAIGLEDSRNQPYLNTAILELMGFEQVSDNLLTKYIALLDKYSERIGADSKSMTKIAFKFYVDLEIEKRKTHKGGVGKGV